MFWKLKPWSPEGEKKQLKGKNQTKLNQKCLYVLERIFLFFYWLLGNLPSSTLIVLISQSSHVQPLAPYLLGDLLTPIGGKVHFLLSIYSLEHCLNPSGQHPKGGWVFLSLHLPQWSSIEESCEIPRAGSPTTTPLPTPLCCGLAARGRVKSQIL